MVSRRVWRRVLIAVAVLAGLLVAADRIALVVAERAAAVTLQNSQHLPQRPAVSISGFPFLTQLAAGEYGHIHVRANGVQTTAEGHDVRIAGLDVTLRHVTVASDFRSATSRSATATATVSYADLSQVLGVQLQYAGDGRISATTSAGVIPGVAVAGTATATPHVSGDSLVFSDVQVSVAGQPVPPGLTSYFTSAFGTSVPLTGLPFGVHVRSVAASAGGVTITLTASELTYRR